jgi:perosamine synthetase
LAISLLEPYKLSEAKKDICNVLDSGWISYTGNAIETLEKRIAEYTGAKFAVATSTGTGALWLILKALGIGPGDKVIVPTMTFVATVNAVIHAGAEPVFVDCTQDLQMDPRQLDFALGLEKNIKAIMPVHMLGNMCDMNKIVELADHYNVHIIEDAAQALGTRYIYNNKHAGTFGIAGMFSFSFNKIITAGQGGMIVTDDESLAKKLKYLSTQAKDDADGYIHNNAGFNMGMSNINASVALSQFDMIDEILKKKEDIWYNYINNGISSLSAYGSNHWLNAIHTSDYKSASKKTSKYFQTRPLFYPNHMQKPFYKYKHYCNNYCCDSSAVRAYKSVMCIPSSTGMTEDQQNIVIQLIRRKVY